MADDYGKAFALRDNPFSPLQDIEGLQDPAHQGDLLNDPLLLSLEPELEKLYSPEAGPFGTFLKNFQTFARQRGYREKRPGVGRASFVFSIYGNEGTGKSTMSQVLIRWVRECKPRVGEWHVFDERAPTNPLDPAKQIERLDAVERKVKAEISERSYCCIVADNLLPGVPRRALALFDDLTSMGKWIVFLFLLSNVGELFKELDGSGKRTIMPFRMYPLSADWAVSFIRRRMESFRDKEVQPSWLKDHPLFPFEEKDIRSAFDSNKVLNYVAEDTVSLRQFSVILNKMLMSRLESLDENFDLATLPENQIKPYLIHLSLEYKRLVA